MGIVGIVVVSGSEVGGGGGGGGWEAQSDEELVRFTCPGAGNDGPRRISHAVHGSTVPRRLQYSPYDTICTTGRFGGIGVAGVAPLVEPFHTLDGARVAEGSARVDGRVLLGPKAACSRLVSTLAALALVVVLLSLSLSTDAARCSLPSLPSPP